MEIFGIVLLVLAYTIGVMTIFLEIICYQRRIENVETIFFTVSFLLLIFALTISTLFDFANHPDNIGLSTFLNFAMTALGLTTPLNIFSERKVKISPPVINAIYMASGFLLLLIILNIVFPFQEILDYIVSGFLVISIVSSMLVIRNTKPRQRLIHREKIERIMAIVILVTMPVIFVFEYFTKNDRFLSFLDFNFSLYVPILFIILATSKFLDDFTRLSLFKPDNVVVQPNIVKYNLTQREKEIADLIIKGHTYAKISESLFISMPTVKTHVSNVYKKVGVNNKMELFYALMN